MKDKIRNIRIDYLLSSIFCILLGLLLIIGRTGVINILGTVLAIMMIIVGAVDLGGYFLSFITGGTSTVIGAILVVLGVWCLFNPALLIGLIPVAIGIILVLLGARSVRNALESRKYGNSSWAAAMIPGVISIVLGLICAFDAFGVLEKAIALVGVILVIIGISNIWSHISGSRAKSDYQQSGGNFRTDDPDIIDVEFKD